MDPTPLTTATPSACTLNGNPVPCDQFLDSFGGLFLGFGIFFFILFILLSVVTMAAFVFQIVMIIHAAQNDIKDRALWIVVMVLTGGLGAVIYYFAVKRPFDQQNTPAAIPTAPPPKPKRRTRRKPASRK